MTDRVLVPLMTGQWLAMPAEAFAAALASGALAMPERQSSAAGSAGPAEPLLDSQAMGELLGCNSTLIEQMAKDGRVPSVRVGRLLRFDRRAVLEALRAGER